MVVMKMLPVRIVRSMLRPRSLSLRAVEDPNDDSSGLKQGLVDAGFKDGDMAVIITKEDYDRLQHISPGKAVSPTSETGTKSESQPSSR